MSRETLLIRADASVAIGTGHVMRCLALAQAWQDGGGDVVFAFAQAMPALAARLRSEGLEVVCLNVEPGGAEDAAQAADLAKARGANWAVVDGYHFPPEYQCRLKEAGLKLLFVDDNGEGERYAADLVLNQNVHASKKYYSHRAPCTRLLLGPRYAMLRREFKTWRAWQREIAPLGCKVLVSMGGSDPDNLTGRVIEAISALKNIEIEARVIVGGSNPNLAALEKLAGTSEGKVRLERNPGNIPELMAWADVAVSAAGSTCWELCFLGLPALVMDVAENQRGIASTLQEKGVAVHLGWAADVTPSEIGKRLEELLRSPDARKTMSQRGKNLVDGYGAERVASAMRWAGLRLRRARESDCRVLWEWANDPGVRSASFSSEPIPWEKHAAWFAHKLDDPNCMIFLATDGSSSPMGQVRFDLLQPGEFETDISVAPERRGSGLGLGLMTRAMEEAFRDKSVRRLHALIKPHNGGSIRLFEAAGFQKRGAIQTRGCEAIHYACERPVETDD